MKTVLPDKTRFSLALFLIFAAVMFLLSSDCGKSPVSPQTPHYFYYFSNQIGSSGRGNGQVAGPTGLALDSSGNLYVADTGNNRIEEFDPSGNYVAQWGSSAPSPGSGNGQFKYPQGIAVNSAGTTFYVADTGNNRVEVFSTSSGYVAQWGSSAPATGGGNGQFNQPSGVGADGAGNVYVADYGNNRIQKFTAGVYAAQWPSSKPFALAVEPSGNILALSSGISIFAMDGSPLSGWSFANPDQNCFNDQGTISPVTGTSAGTNGVALDYSGNVYVTIDDEVLEYTLTGGFLAEFGGPGSQYGSLGQLNGAGVAVDASGNVYVADNDNGQIDLFKPSPTLLKNQ